MSALSVKAASSASPARVATVLGTMSIPVPLDAAATREALDYFAAAGFDEIDTAIMYQGGKSENALGESSLVGGAFAAAALAAAAFAAAIVVVIFGVVVVAIAIYCCVCFKRPSSV